MLMNGVFHAITGAAGRYFTASTSFSRSLASLGHGLLVIGSDGT
jgi:hypothetical protein